MCCAPKSLGEKLVGAKRGGDMMRGGKQSKRDVCVYRQYKKKKKKKKTFFFFLVEACIHTALAFKEEKRFSGLRGVYSIYVLYI